MENKSGNSRKNFPFKLLKEITNFFSEERILGQGAFGRVYKGVFEDGEQIAVKILRFMPEIKNKQFKTEFENLNNLKHPNIVRLVGFCYESEEVVLPCEGKQVHCEKIHMALCLEYMPQGSLSDHLSRNTLGTSWPMRYRIIKGICEGLKYLHEESILHCDLKPGNILLDGEMVPKIADFGISRLVGEENTKRTMSPLGTLGYLPPEFITKQIISREYDIFSLGVIIMKIMTGTMDNLSIDDMEPPEFIEHVHDSWRNILQELPRNASLEADCKQIKRCIEIAVYCMDKDRHKRPKMKDIVRNLDETENKENNLLSQMEKFHNVEPIISRTNSRERSSTSFQGRNDKAIRPNNRGSSGNDPSGTLCCIPFYLLKEITENFSERLRIDEDAFSVVYKGVLKNGKEIAVRIHREVLENLDGSIFQNNLQNLMRLRHQNVVQLVGYVYEIESIQVEYNGKMVLADRVYRAICLEHLDKGNLEMYLSDESCGLDWHLNYKIIKGICVGLRYLHMGLEHPIYHLDLNPRNIGLDKNMEPKIKDFGISRFMDGEQVQITISSLGTTGYLPPEYIDYNLISNKFDIFSLGVIMVKMMAGLRGYPKCLEMHRQDFIELVLRNWRLRLEATCRGILLEGYCHQVMKCIKIALKCIDSDRHKRPSISDIVHMLDETETLILKEDPVLLDVDPLQLCFPFEPKRASSCSLQLNNKGGDHIAFRLLTKSLKRNSTNPPLCGIVPPRCTYTLALTMRKQPQKSPPDSNEAFILQSVAVTRAQDLENLDQRPIAVKYEELFKKTKETASGNMKEVEVKVVSDQPTQHDTSEPTRQPAIKITATPNAKKVSSIQVHPMEPWIMTTYCGGHLHVWNYKTMALLNSFQVTEETVHAANFVVREKWIVAGDANGYLHVYSYDDCQGISSFEAHDGCILSLAVHPTDPYVLSSSQVDHEIKLWHWDEGWDWEAGWVCTRTFEGHSDKVSQVIFNPEDTGSFISASCDGTVNIWDLKSDLCGTITLEEHPDSLLLVDYVTGGLWSHLITRKMDGTAQDTSKC